MKLQLEGRAAIITGAGGGIGAAVATAFAAEGADVCLADLKPASELADSVRAQGRQAIDVPTGVTQRAQVEQLAEKALAAFGKIDILVNIAGTTSFGSLHRT